MSEKEEEKPADEAAAGAGGSDADENPSVQEMQEGEYQLHVLIEKG